MFRENKIDSAETEMLDFVWYGFIYNNNGSVSRVFGLVWWTDCQRNLYTINS